MTTTRKRGKSLTYEDRKRIESLYISGADISEISGKMGRHLSTMYRELAKGSTGMMDKNGRIGYSARIAQESVLGLTPASKHICQQEQG